MREWSVIFYFSSSICVVAGLIFLIFASSEKQTWNNPIDQESFLNPGLPTATLGDLDEGSSSLPPSSPQGSSPRGSPLIEPDDERPGGPPSYPELRRIKSPPLVLKKEVISVAMCYILDGVCVQRLFVNKYAWQWLTVSKKQ
ncbi:hypothetical protein CEXT_564061 [Caerostris extrusa]|uniref:Uncharacterized protein n=1 Tax=Caerostris extrusa TaxID=172846 RepID=A0AAV4NBC8_CAEEX|nr:hypothetical protein CEXT_564061 [Caerostris extrusa]